MGFLGDLDENNNCYHIFNLVSGITMLIKYLY